MFCIVCTGRCGPLFSLHRRGLVVSFSCGFCLSLFITFLCRPTRKNASCSYRSRYRLAARELRVSSSRFDFVLGVRWHMKFLLTIIPHLHLHFRFFTALVPFAMTCTLWLHPTRSAARIPLSFQKVTSFWCNYTIFNRYIAYDVQIFRDHYVPLDTMCVQGFHNECILYIRIFLFK